MARARRSRRTLTTLVVLVLLSVSIITLDESGRAHTLISGTKSVASDVFSPIRSAANAVIDPIGRFFAGAIHYGAVQQENQKLQAEIGRLRQAQATQKFARTQLAQLTRLLKTDKLPSVATLTQVTAEVTGLTPSNFANTVVIDKGRSDGVAYGDPVVAAGGLVGRVVFAADSTATVRLITTGSSSVGVAYGKSTAQLATLAGQGAGKDLSVDSVRSSTPISAGETLYTDGLAGAEFPKGLPVAKVSTVHTVPGAADREVVAEPIADLSSLAYVTVLQWSPTP